MKNNKNIKKVNNSNINNNADTGANNLKNKKALLIVMAVLVVVLLGASIMYNQFADKVDKTSIAQTQNSSSDSSGENVNQKYETQKAPDFTVVDLNGEEVKLSDFFGKPIILNFWASWCEPCKMEMPHFNEAYEKYKDEINFLMVNLSDDANESVENAYMYIREQGFSFPVYYDAVGEAATTYGIYSIPTTFFIDKNGVFAANAKGAIDADVLQQGIDMIYTAQ